MGGAGIHSSTTPLGHRGKRPLTRTASSPAYAGDRWVEPKEAADAAEPGKGYAEKAAEYRALLKAREAQREAGAPAP